MIVLAWSPSDVDIAESPIKNKEVGSATNVASLTMSTATAVIASVCESSNRLKDSGTALGIAAPQ